MSIDTSNFNSIFDTTIELDYGKLQAVLDWCERNCENDYRYIDLNDPDHDSETACWKFFFDSEKDYIAFLMWKK